MASNARTCRICFDTKCENRVTFDSADSEWTYLFEFCVGVMVVAIYVWEHKAQYARRDDRRQRTLRYGARLQPVAHTLAKSAKTAHVMGPDVFNRLPSEEPESNAPRVLCKSCADKLRSFAEFKNKCLKSDTFWKKVATKITLGKKENTTIKEEKKDVKCIDVEDLSDSFVDTDFDNNYDEIDHYTDAASPVKTDTTNPNPVRKSTRIKKIPKTFTIDSKTAYRAPPSSVNFDITATTDKKINLKSTGTPVKIITYVDDVTKPKIEDDDFITFKTPKHPAPPSKKTSKKRLHIKSRKPSISTMKQVKLSESEYTDPSSSNSQNVIKPIKIISYVNYSNNSDASVSSKADDEFDTGIEEGIDKVELTDEEKDDHEMDPDYDPSNESDPSRNHVQFMFGIELKRLKDTPQLEYHSTGIETARTSSVKDLPESPYQYCGICKYQCSSKYELYTHWKGHISKNNLKCRLCEYIGRDFADMAAHRYKHHPSEFKHTVCCLLCPQKFIWGTVYMSLEFHYREFHLHKKGGWCNICGKESKTMKFFKSHAESHVNPYVCDHCGKTFSDRYNLKDHLKLVFGGVKHYCDHCGRSFNCRRNMLTHVLNKHTKSELKCDQCNEILPTPTKLKYHRRKHQGKTHFCEICAASFFDARDLASHKIMHSDDRPFACDSCGKKFKRKHALVQHIMGHSGIKPYQCLTCGKCFNKKNILKRHEIAHTGIRPVKCTFDQCGSTFYCKTAMIAHCKSKHEIQ